MGIYRCLNFCWIFKPTNTWNVAFYDALVLLRPINESALIIPATFSFYENNARRLCQSIIFSRRWTTQLLKHSVTSWNGVCSRSKGEYRLLSFLHAAWINCQQMSENYFKKPISFEMQLHNWLISLFISFCVFFMNKRREIPRLDITLQVVEIKYTNVWQYISSFERQICCWLMVFYIIASSFLLRQGKQNSLVVAFFHSYSSLPVLLFQY